AAPILADITVGGRKIKAVVQVTKQSFAYVLDRVTGKPVWPIEERPVPPSTVPGEKASPTQPFPTRPPAFDRQGVTIDDLIDFTPELRAEAIEIVKKYVTGPVFTPPSGVDGAERRRSAQSSPVEGSPSAAARAGRARGAARDENAAVRQRGGSDQRADATHRRRQEVPRVRQGDGKSDLGDRARSGDDRH